MSFPDRYLPPPGMDEAMLVIETGFMPDQLEVMPEALIQRMIIYMNVKQAAQYGGTYNG